jgi:hypothetical protein
MTPPLDLARATWTKSSYSGPNGGQCLAFSRTFANTGIVPIRDTKTPHGPTLTTTTDQWNAFITYPRTL